MKQQLEVLQYPPRGVELTRKELGDIFGVSCETIKRRTKEGHLKPVAKNSRVLHYGENDIQSMVEMGYRLDRSRAQAYQLPFIGPAETQLGRAPQVPTQTSDSPDPHSELRKVLQQHRNDLVSKHIILRFAAALILDEEPRPT